MKLNDLTLEGVQKQARAILGDEAGLWMVKPNRRLAQLAPVELANDRAGASIVLMELERLAEPVAA